MAKSLTTRQAQWVDVQNPQDSALPSMSSIINDLYQLGGVFVTYTANATPNTADTLTHNLGRVPQGFIVIGANLAATVYDGGGANTATTISLKCSVASVVSKLLVF